MDERFDDKTTKELISALDKLEESAAKDRQKKEERLWQEINLPCQLRDALGWLKKYELDEIRKKLDLKNMSSLKKQELTDQLERSIPEQSQVVFKRFDEERYNLAKRIAQNGGYIYENDLDLEKADYYREYGIIFTGTNNGKRVLVMPREVLEQFDKINTTELVKLVKRNNEWIRLTHGLLHYYGVLSITQLQDMISKLTGEKQQNAHYIFDYIEVIFNARQYYGQIEHFTDGFKDARVFDHEALMQDQELRAEIKYYPFTKEQLLKASAVGYVERTATFNHFVAWIQNNYEISKRDAAMLAEECTEIIQEGEGLKDVMDYLSTELECLSLDATQELTKEVVNLSNNTRQWVLKGHTPNELARVTNIPLAAQPTCADVIDIKTRQKVGRNDPCPCGSGKKFKKCCLDT